MRPFLYVMKNQRQPDAGLAAMAGSGTF